MPEDEIEAHLETRMAADRTQRVDVGAAAAGAPQQRLGDLRPWLHALRELAVEQAQARGPQHAPAVVVIEDRVDPVAGSLQEIAGAEQLGRRALAHACLVDDQPVEHEQAEALADIVEARAEVALSRRRLEHPDGGALPDGQTRADVEQVCQIVIGVEQVRMQRGRRRPPQHPLRLQALQL